MTTTCLVSDFPSLCCPDTTSSGFSLPCPTSPALLQELRGAVRGPLPGCVSLHPTAQRDQGLIDTQALPPGGRPLLSSTGAADAADAPPISPGPHGPQHADLTDSSRSTWDPPAVAPPAVRVHPAAAHSRPSARESPSSCWASPQPTTPALSLSRGLLLHSVPRRHPRHPFLEQPP